MGMRSLAILLLLAFPSLAADQTVNGLHLVVTGAGPTTVVLESGFGAASGHWARLTPEIAKFARVVAYDRAGLGASEASTKPRTAAQIAKELHQALESAKIAPPYVLVSHSAGASSMRLFAHLFPRDVAGLVLIDPPIEEFLDWLSAKNPEMDKMPAERLAKMPAGIRAEWDARAASIEEMRGAWPLPSVPTVLITSARHDQSMENALGAESLQTMHTAREHFLQRVPSAKQIIAEKSGHNIPGDEPELVIAAIRQVVAESGSPASRD
jgi:pimeloyl-ACP methyl ester carboxylesterase